MRIKAIGKRITVDPIEWEERTKAGIYLPEQAKEKPQTARVTSVGSKVKEVKAGDVICYEKYAGNEVKFPLRKVLIISEEEVLGVIIDGGEDNVQEEL